MNFFKLQNNLKCITATLFLINFINELNWVSSTILVWVLSNFVKSLKEYIIKIANMKFFYCEKFYVGYFTTVDSIKSFEIDLHDFMFVCN